MMSSPPKENFYPHDPVDRVLTADRYAQGQFCHRKGA